MHHLYQCSCATSLKRGVFNNQIQPISGAQLSGSLSSRQVTVLGAPMTPPAPCSPAPPQPGGTRTSLEQLLLAGPSTGLLTFIPQRPQMPHGFSWDVGSFNKEEISKDRSKISRICLFKNTKVRTLTYLLQTVLLLPPPTTFFFFLIANSVKLYLFLPW